MYGFFSCLKHYYFLSVIALPSLQAKSVCWLCSLGGLICRLGEMEYLQAGVGTVCPGAA